jgi:hypothetical protein
MAAARRRTWREKLADDKGFPRVSVVEGRMAGRWGMKAGETFVIASPRKVEGLMRRVRKGRLTTVGQLRAALAKKHGATTACPVTTGIFAWIAAHAAAEAEAAGSRRVMAYWRTLKAGGEINGKYPGGAAGCARRLRAEGHRVVRRGKKWVVEGWEGKV